MSYDKKDFDPKAAFEARKKEMNEITEKLEKGVKDIFSSENYKKYLEFCAKLPRYSVNNQILIMMQKPEATMCQSFTGWKEMNRHVIKGEKGIRILAPAPYKMEREQDKIDGNGKTVLDKDGEPVKEKVEITVNAFKPVSTFDVSQTEGEPIPTFGITELTGRVDGYKTLLDALKEVIPVPITFENIESGAKGYYHLEDDRIAVQEGMSEVQTVKTILHEACHQALHSKAAMESSGEKKSKNQIETEAESVAFVVCSHLGIDTSDYSFSYLASFADGKEVPELKASLDTIRKTAADMIQKIDDEVKVLTETKDIEEFMEVHGDELPFADPEGYLPPGFMEITPPIDFSDCKKEKKITLSSEPKDETKGSFKNESKGKTIVETKGKSKDIRDESKDIKNETKDIRDKTKEKDKPSKRISVKDRLTAEKAKVSKETKTRKEPKKDLQAAM